jgi:hypothetical protein
MTPNPGYCPDEARGKRVRVLLENGTLGAEDPGSTTPNGWAADGRGACRWTRTGFAFEIAKYEVIG